MYYTRMNLAATMSQTRNFSYTIYIFYINGQVSVYYKILVNSTQV